MIRKNHRKDNVIALVIRRERERGKEQKYKKKLVIKTKQQRRDYVQHIYIVEENRDAQERER